MALMAKRILQSAFYAINDFGGAIEGNAVL